MLYTFEEDKRQRFKKHSKLEKLFIEQLFSEVQSISVPELCNRKRYSRDKLAQILGISLSQLLNIEKKKQKIPIKNLEKLVKHLEEN